LVYFFAVLDVGSRDALKREISVIVKIRTSSCLLMLYGGIMLAKAVLNSSLQPFKQNASQLQLVPTLKTIQKQSPGRHLTGMINTKCISQVSQSLLSSLWGVGDI